jgi:hypothetical protein
LQAAITRSNASIASHLLRLKNFYMRAYFPFRFLAYLPLLPRLPLGKRGWLLGDFACRLASAIA